MEKARLWNRATATHEERRNTGPVFIRPDAAPDPSFVVREGALEVVDEVVFERQPSEMIRVFSLAIDVDLPIGLRTRELIGELAASRAEGLREDVDSGRRFVDLLCDARDR